MVAPLIFRNHAVFRDAGRHCVWVSSCNHSDAPKEADNEHEFPVLGEDQVWLVRKQFMDTQGRYTLVRGANETQVVDFQEAHQRLLPIGTFLLVKNEALGTFGMTSEREWVRGSLRYPDEGIVGAEIFPHRVYFAINVRERNFTQVRIMCVEPDQCCVLEEHSEINISLVATDVVVQPLAAGQQQAAE